MDLMKLYEKFSNEYKIVAQSFFTWKLINNIASNNEKILSGLRENSSSWNIILYSLQATYFLALRRIFDNDNDTFSADSLLKSCIDNISEFGKDKIAERKMGENSSKPEWLDKYLEKVYQIEQKDIQKLRGELSKQKKKYEDKFRAIVNKVIAHSEIKYLENANSLFVGATIGDMEEIINFLFQIEMILFDLLHNGRFEQIGSYQFKEEEYLSKDVNSLLNKISA
jgi:hypothetical protein